MTSNSSLLHDAPTSPSGDHASRRPPFGARLEATYHAVMTIACLLAAVAMVVLSTVGAVHTRQPRIVLIGVVGCAWFLALAWLNWRRYPSARRRTTSVLSRRLRRRGAAHDDVGVRQDDTRSR